MNKEEIQKKIRTKELEIYDLETGITALRTRSHKAQEELLGLKKQLLIL